MDWWKTPAAAHSPPALQYSTTPFTPCPPSLVACHAMATRFEIVLHGENPAALRAAGEEALRQIEQLEAQLSLFRASSEIAHLNARAAQGPVRVTPGLFALLQHAQQAVARRAAARSILPLPRWSGAGGSWAGEGRFPRPEEVAEARAKVGMGLVQLNPARLHRPVRARGRDAGPGRHRQGLRGRAGG